MYLNQPDGMYTSENGYNGLVSFRDTIIMPRFRDVCILVSCNVVITVRGMLCKTVI